MWLDLDRSARDDLVLVARLGAGTALALRDLAVVDLDPPLYPPDLF